MNDLFPAQQQLLAAVRRAGVQRRCYRSESPGGVDLRWHRIAVDTKRRFSYRTVDALVRRGLATVVRGKLRDDTPEGLSGLERTGPSSSPRATW